MKPLIFNKMRTLRLSNFPSNLLAVLLISLTFILPGVHAQQSAQLSLADIIIALRSTKVTLAERNEILTGAVRERGITFELTPQIEKELENTGASQALIDSIKQKGTVIKIAATTQPKPTPVATPAPIPVEPEYVYYKKQADDNVSKGDLEIAMANYNKAIQLSPQNSALYLNRALVFLKKKDYEKAIADYDKVIELSPNDLIAYANRANSYEKVGNTEKAVADYKKIIEIDDKNESAINNLKRIEDERARILQKQKEQDAALAQAETEKEKPKEESKAKDVQPVKTETSDSSQVIDLGRLNSTMAIDMATPIYSQIAKSLNLQGQVTVQVTLDEEGKVTSAEATDGHKLLRESAEQAARRSKFKPAMVGDKAVKSKGYIVYNFVR